MLLLSEKKKKVPPGDTKFSCTGDKVACTSIIMSTVWFLSLLTSWADSWGAATQDRNLDTM